MTELRDRLKEIRTFPSLVKFLRDELDWPIDSTDDFDDLVFDYTPEELGIDAASAVKIDEIKRLRPLSHTQPWGIFFVKFEPKQLPVVALRRILNRVVVKKRATGSAAEQQRWATDDLLFISAYGNEGERRISFAHFSQDPAAGELATLKVLAWDEQDTGLHLDDVAQRLVEHLSWPAEADEWDDETWRERWSSAFELRHREVITTSKALAIELADLARAVRERINAVLGIESEDGPVTRLMNAFREALVHDLEPDDFGDMYAQTIAYGLLSARVANPMGNPPTDGLPVTNPFLRELMEEFLHIGEGHSDRSTRIDFDELGVSDVLMLLDDANMEAVIRDFGDKNPQEDPVIHFYELFLKEYDAKKRMQRGVFYTPRPVVSYIVRSVDEVLRTKFGLEDGLADVTNWGEMAERHSGLEIPDGVSSSQAFVQILDPAAGTGTFLVEVIDVIYKTLVAKWKEGGHSETEVEGLWNDYVPTHLLPRLHGFELLMAPYAIAHLKIGLKLYETGYRFGSDERARIYLTNTLDPPHDFSDRLAFAVPALAHEGQAVNAVKRDHRFTVVIGNPPYSVLSANLTETHRSIINAYRQVDGEAIREKSMLRLEMHLQDDYVKFFRQCEILIARSKVGALGLISNSGYLDSLSLRGMRSSLCRSFNAIRILNLHGSRQRSTKALRAVGDENVFDIEQGVGVFTGLTTPETPDGHVVSYGSLVGSREEKYAALLLQASIPYERIYPTSSMYFLVPRDVELNREFESGVPLDELFGDFVTGMVTAHDHLVIDFADSPLKEITRRLRDVEMSDTDVRELLSVKDNAGWKLADARAKLRATEDGDQWYRDLDYRPFDVRRINYHPALVWSDRRRLMRVFLDGDNVALSVSRQLSALPWNHVFVGRHLVESAFVSNRSREICHVMPRWVSADGLSSGEGLLSGRVSNLKISRLREASACAGCDEESAFAYIYAILHSQGYRSRYADLLSKAFPRILLPREPGLFDQLVAQGRELITLHLMDSSAVDSPSTTFIGSAQPRVERISWVDETVWLDAPASKKGQAAARGTIGFQGVPEAVWEHEIGCYRVCEKWLKDRRGRTLSDEEVVHYQRIVAAISETIRRTAEIDGIIEQHGGWPGAFVTSASEVAS
jgi:hypothetical protein